MLVHSAHEYPVPVGKPWSTDLFPKTRCHVHAADDFGYRSSKKSAGGGREALTGQG
jgi:hypothetical protein